MRVNISAIKLFQHSQLEWFYRYHLRRVPRKEPGSYLHTGTWWHKSMEVLGRTQSIPQTIAASESLRDSIAVTLSGEILDDFLDETIRLGRLLNIMPQRFIPSSIIAIEEPIEIKLPGSEHTLVGRPDQVVVLHGKHWHLQFKTISDRTPISVFIESRRRDLHELAYAWLISGRYCTLSQYGGTLLNVVRKISNKVIETKPESAFVQELIPIEERDIHEALFDIVAVADDMAAIISGSRRIIQNRDADTNRFRNAFSPYYPALSGQVSITDDTYFMDAPPDPYDIQETE